MDNDSVTFTVTCTMKRRWADQFLSMLAYMQACGEQGRSRQVGIYADGDGDFRPKFATDYSYTTAMPKNDNNGDRLYDTG